jgi:hypothetical protein
MHNAIVAVAVTAVAPMAFILCIVINTLHSARPACGIPMGMPDMRGFQRLVCLSQAVVQGSNRQISNAILSAGIWKPRNRLNLLYADLT